MTTSLSPAANVLLDRAGLGIEAARAATNPGLRLHTAHLAALRAAAAVCAVRGRPGSRGGPRSIWDVLPGIAPTLADWAPTFAASARRRDDVEYQRGEPVTADEADEQLRRVEEFLAAVHEYLDVPYQPALGSSDG